jgi:dynein heavy chain
MDTTRYSYMLRTIIASGRHVLFTGDTGVGKSVIVADSLSRMTSGNEAKFVSATVNFSAQTQSWNLQEVLETKLDKKRKNRYAHV